MKKIIQAVFVFILGMASSLLLIGYFSDIDLLSENKDYSVSLLKDLSIKDASGLMFDLPKGTVLRYDSQYLDSGELSLKIVITNLDVVEKNQDGDIYYYSQ